MLSMLDIVYTGAFLYNFTKDINWPKAYMNGDYMFGGVSQHGFYLEWKIAAAHKIPTHQPLFFISINAV